MCTKNLHKPNSLNNSCSACLVNLLSGGNSGFIALV